MTQSKMTHTNQANYLTGMEFFSFLLFIILLLGMLAMGVRYFVHENLLATKAQEIVDDLHLAQTRSISSYKNNSWGVYFQTAEPQKWVVFKGQSYTSRDPDFDLPTNLPEHMSFKNIQLEGGQTEIVFLMNTGNTSQSGFIVLEKGQEGSKTLTIDSEGRVNLE